MGILRNTIVIGAVALALPNPPASEQTDGIVPPTVSNVAYVAAAAETFADVRNFCQRRPAVCSTAGTIATTMEAKAKYSAKLIYEWANEAGSDQVGKSMLPQDLATADPIATGTADTRASGKADQSTLTLTDLIPQWQPPAKTSRPPKKG